MVQIRKTGKHIEIDGFIEKREKLQRGKIFLRPMFQSGLYRI